MAANPKQENLGPENKRKQNTPDNTQNTPANTQKEKSLVSAKPIPEPKPKEVNRGYFSKLSNFVKGKLQTGQKAVKGIFTGLRFVGWFLYFTCEELAAPVGRALIKTSNGFLSILPSCPRFIRTRRDNPRLLHIDFVWLMNMSRYLALGATVIAIKNLLYLPFQWLAARNREPNIQEENQEENSIPLMVCSGVIFFTQSGVFIFLATKAIAYNKIITFCHSREMQKIALENNKQLTQFAKLNITIKDLNSIFRNIVVLGSSSFEGMFIGLSIACIGIPYLGPEQAIVTEVFRFCLEAYALGMGIYAYPLSLAGIPRENILNKLTREKAFCFGKGLVCAGIENGAGQLISLITPSWLNPNWFGPSAYRAAIFSSASYNFFLMNFKSLQVMELKKAHLKTRYVDIFGFCREFTQESLSFTITYGIPITIKAIKAMRGDPPKELTKDTKETEVHKAVKKDPKKTKTDKPEHATAASKKTQAHEPQQKPTAPKTQASEAQQKPPAAPTAPALSSEIKEAQDVVKPLKPDSPEKPATPTAAPTAPKSELKETQEDLELKPIEDLVTFIKGVAGFIDWSDPSLLLFFHVYKEDIIYTLNLIDVLQAKSIVQWLQFIQLYSPSFKGDEQLRIFLKYLERRVDFNKIGNLIKYVERQAQFGEENQHMSWRAWLKIILQNKSNGGKPHEDNDEEPDDIVFFPRKHDVQRQMKMEDDVELERIYGVSVLEDERAFEQVCTAIKYVGGKMVGKIDPWELEVLDGTEISKARKYAGLFEDPNASLYKNQGLAGNLAKAREALFYQLHILHGAYESCKPAKLGDIPRGVANLAESIQETLEDITGGETALNVVGATATLVPGGGIVTAGIAGYKIASSYASQIRTFSEWMDYFMSSPEKAPEKELLKVPSEVKIGEELKKQADAKQQKDLQQINGSAERKTALDANPTTEPSGNPKNPSVDLKLLEESRAEKPKLSVPATPKTTNYIYASLESLGLISSSDQRIALTLKEAASPSETRTTNSANTTAQPAANQATMPQYLGNALYDTASGVVGWMWSAKTVANQPSSNAAAQVSITQTSNAAPQNTTTELPRSAPATQPAANQGTMAHYLGNTIDLATGVLGWMWPAKTAANQPPSNALPQASLPQVSNTTPQTSNATPELQPQPQLQPQNRTTEMAATLQPVSSPNVGSTKP